MNRLEECTYKVKKVRAMLKETGYEGIIIRKQPNFSWITAGGRGFIGLASENSCATIVITRQGVYLAGNNIEVPRLLAEELPVAFAEPVTLAWQNDGTIDAVLAQRFGKLTTDTEQDQWFREERVNLLESEEGRFEKLGMASVAVLEKVCTSLKPGTTELETAGKISEGLWGAGIEPITLLIAADERSNSVRHYVPGNKKITQGAICSICARAGGLVVSATRTVGFNKDFSSSYGQLLQVEHSVFESIRPGISLRDVLEKMIGAYAQNGLPEEWKNHHQGGLTGYLAREIRVEPGCPKTIRTGQAFAWNPSAPGAKCEETVFLGQKGLRSLTEPGPHWPVVTLGGIRCSGVLRL
jgi:Xaa-Pro aminopeptidase